MLSGKATDYAAGCLAGKTVEAEYSPASIDAISPKYPAIYTNAVKANQLVIAMAKSASQSVSRKNRLK